MIGTRTLEKRGAGRLAYVVDDELLLAQILEAILKMDGFEVRSFTCPRAAWKAFEAEETKPALLVTDYAMQPFTGLELLARCREASPQLRSLVVSGNAGQEVFTESALQPDAFLEKPFLPQKLLEAAHWALQKS